MESGPRSSRSEESFYLSSGSHQCPAHSPGTAHHREHPWLFPGESWSDGEQEKSQKRGGKHSQHSLAETEIQSQRRTQSQQEQCSGSSVLFSAPSIGNHTWDSDLGTSQRVLGKDGGV